MLTVFPPGTTATVIVDCERPYPDLIAARAGALVRRDAVRSRETDMLG